MQWKSAVARILIQGVTIVTKNHVKLFPSEQPPPLKVEVYTEVILSQVEVWSELPTLSDSFHFLFPSSGSSLIENVWLDESDVVNPVVRGESFLFTSKREKS